MPPQNGAVTHHQDQLMTPQSFSVTNTTPSNPNTPMPPPLLELLLLMFFSFVICISLHRLPVSLSDQLVKLFDPLERKRRALVVEVPPASLQRLFLCGPQFLKLEDCQCREGHLSNATHATMAML